MTVVARLVTVAVEVASGARPLVTVRRQPKESVCLDAGEGSRVDLLQSVGRASSRRARLMVGAQVGATKSTVSVLDSVL